MPRRTVYIDEATDRILRHGFPDEYARNFSRLVQRAIYALLENLPVGERGAIFTRAADELEAEARARLEGDPHSRRVGPPARRRRTSTERRAK